MKTEVRVIGRVLVVGIWGELDLNTAPSFRSAVEEQLDANPDVIDILLMMSNVTFIDSSGLGAILGTQKTNAHGGMLSSIPSCKQEKPLNYQAWQASFLFATRKMRHGPRLGGVT